METSANAVLSLTELRLLLARPESGPVNASSVIGEAYLGTHVTGLAAPLLRAARQLACWMVTRDPCGPMVLTVTWEERVVLVEVRDSGVAVPKPESVRADAELATRLLVPPATEWGAESDDDGRRLWVALPTVLHPIALGYA